MYSLAVGCLFKNETNSMKEWLEHYLKRGVEHFYMINDKSTDDYLSILQPYIDKNIVSLFEADCRYYLGRQRDLYNTYILPRLKETKWLLMVDLDEYCWSPQCINLNDLLKQCGHLAQIQFGQALYGSSGHITQPESIVKYFTMRKKEYCKCYKYFVNSSYEFTSLNVHHADFKNIEDKLHKFIILDENYFINNHYNCQSLEFWQTIKCTRGDSDHYRIRTMEDFKAVDINEIEDIRLYLQL